MGIWQRLMRPFSRADEQKMTSLELFREIYGGTGSSSGVSVTTANSLEVTTVLGCARVLAEGVAQVPFRVYRELDEGRQVARDSAVNRLIYRRPNRWQTSFEFRETIMFHLVLAGNAFVFVNRVGSEGEPRELVPIEPGRVEVKRLNGDRLEYKVRGDQQGEEKIFPQEAIWHLRGPSWNSWMGMDAVKLARDAIGLSMALESSHAALHKGGSQMSGLLSMQDSIGPEKFKSLMKWLERYAAGGDLQHKPLILDRGATWTSMQMKGVDSQHLETRKHQIEEVCRAFRVMPIMIGHADKTATYASAEQMFLAHVVHTLSPWYERIEQSADENLLTERQRDDGFYTKFTPNALMRGAAQDRAEFYSKALGAGGHGTAWMTPNEARTLEDMDKISDPAADRLPSPQPGPQEAPGG